MRNALESSQNLDSWKNGIDRHYAKQEQNHVLEDLFFFASLSMISIVLMFIQLFLPIGFEMVIILSIVIVYKSTNLFAHNWLILSRY